LISGVIFLKSYWAAKQGGKAISIARKNKLIRPLIRFIAGTSIHFTSESRFIWHLLGRPCLQYWSLSASTRGYPRPHWH